MIKKLLIVFASAAILCVATLGGIWLFAGKSIEKQLAEGADWNWTFGDDEDEGPRKTRSFTIDPAVQLAMEIPVDLSFTRGDAPSMTVEGPANVVDRLTWEGGHLALPDTAHMRHGLKVRITAPEITGLDLDAPANVTLTGLDQDAFTLNGSGAVNLEASGKLRKVNVSTDGAGHIDLSKVDGEDATVRVDGAGDVTLGATNLVDVHINGVGHVSLVKKPKTLRTQINGIGSVDHDY